MNRGSTLFLKGALVIIGLFVLAVCLFVLYPALGLTAPVWYRPILATIFVTLIPFFFGLFQTLRLLSCIDTNRAFSVLSVAALSKIKYYAASIGLIYTVLLPYVYIVADKYDAPALIVIDLLLIFAAIVVATFAAVLQKLLQSAIDIQTENELTV